MSAQCKLKSKEKKDTRTKSAPIGQELGKDNGRNKSLEKLKVALVERRNTLRRGLNEEENEITTEKNKGVVGDVADLALASSENELEYHIYETGLKEFEQIERAIKRFSEGSYGTCEDCGQPIPIARLKVLPFAGKCVHCQQMSDENREFSPAEYV